MTTTHGTSLDDSQSTEADDVSQETQGTNTDGQDGSEGTPSVDEALDGLESLEDLERALSDAKDPNLKKPEGSKADDRNDDNEEEGEEGEGEEENDEQAQADDKARKGGDDDKGGDKGAPRNFRFTGVKDPKMSAFLQLLRRNPDVDPHTLAEQAGYTTKQAAAAVNEAEGKGNEGGDGGNQATEIPAELKPHADAVTTLDAEIASLQKQIEEAEAGYKPTGKLNSQLTLAAAKLETAKRELSDAKREYAADQAWQQGYDRDLTATRAEMVERYPDIGVADSVAYSLVVTELQKARAADPNFINNPRYPAILVERLEKKHPTHFPKKGTGKITEVVPNKKPRQEARELGSQVVAGNRSTEITLNTDKEIDDALEGLSLEDLDKVGNLVGHKGRRS